MDIHVQCGLLALLGIALNVTIKIKSLIDKAQKANVKFSIGEYFKQDWLMLIASVITIGIFLFLIDDIVNLHVTAIYWVKFLFAFVGYTGSDIILRLFSAANKKINNIINTKTTVADTLSHNMANPTNIEQGKIIP